MDRTLKCAPHHANAQHVELNAAAVGYSSNHAVPTVAAKLQKKDAKAHLFIKVSRIEIRMHTVILVHQNDGPWTDP